MLSVNRVNFSRGDTRILDDVTFEMAPGEIVALLGPNGSGKTTLMRCMLGQLKLEGGDIVIGEGPSGDGSAPLISWVPQRVTIFPLLTVAQNLAEFARLMGVHSSDIDARVKEVLAFIGLEQRANDLARSLSGGMQRMLNVGIGLVSNPRILLVDEPTAGIDRAAHERLYAVLGELKERGLSILLTTHDLNDVSRLASRAVILVKGRVCAQGSVDELLHTRFEHYKEVHIEVANGREDTPEVCEALAEVGLQPQGDGEWHGLAGRHNGQLERLYQIVDGHEHLIRDFSLKTPGLELLIQALLDDARPQG